MKLIIKKAFLLGLVLCAPVLFTCGKEGRCSAREGWTISSTGNRIYLETDGTLVTGLKVIQGSQYYFDCTGTMAFGWKYISGEWYYFGSDGKSVSGFQNIGQRMYLFDSEGKMKTGWVFLDRHWYFFRDDGQMATGTVTIGTGNYRFNENGTAVSGWVREDGKWKFFNSTGRMRTGLQKLGSETYYFEKDGTMATGWRKLDGSWYYFGESGHMAKGFVSIGSFTYRFDEKGIMKTGWQNENGCWYYFSGSGHMATGFQTIGSFTYRFNENGVMTTGWLESEGNWYYFGSSGHRAEGFTEIGTVTYLFDGNGVMQTGWQESEGKTFYFGSTGHMTKGWKTIDETRYFFDRETGERLNGEHLIDGVWYVFSDTGVYDRKGTVFRRKKDAFLEETETAAYSYIGDHTIISITTENTSKYQIILSHILVKDPEKQFYLGFSNGVYGGTQEAVSHAAKRLGAVLAINGSFFAYDTGKPINGMQIQDGKQLNSVKYTTGSEVAVTWDGRIFSPPAGKTYQSLVEQGVRFTVQTCEPTSIENGNRLPIKSGTQTAGRYPRTMLAMVEPGEYYILTAGTGGYRYGLTGAEAQDIMMEKGCTYARFLDEGGSVSLAFLGSLLNRTINSTERMVADFLYFLE